MRMIVYQMINKGEALIDLLVVLKEVEARGKETDLLANLIALNVTRWPAYHI
jgi:hypothetical protein